MRRILISGALLAAVAVFMVIAGGSTSGFTERGTTYKIDLDNAFGLVKGADFKVAGVPAGKISKIDLKPACKGSDSKPGDTKQCYAEVTVKIKQGGFGSFHRDAFCQSRPQSLIGEYFLACQPGSKGPVIQPGSTVPVSNTESTIPADVLLNVMRMPYRERFTLIINELGAGVAGRSGDLQAALQRALPALTETNRLLKLLGDDSSTLQDLTVNSDKVVTDLANNSKDVQRFIDEANKAAGASATQQHNIAASVHLLPGFLEQLKPVMAQLGGAVDANQPAVAQLGADAGQLNRLFRDIPGFSRASLPAIKALGQASVTGKTAVQAARPLVAHLNQFAKPTPELAQNLSIVLHDLDDRSRAVEADATSPGGKGYTGLEALLQYAFNQTLVTNTLSPLGHIFNVDLYYDPICSPYASQDNVATNLSIYGNAARRCYAWLGPSQPGLNEPDPSNPGGCVPDPGGAPPGQRGPGATACKLSATSAAPGLLAVDKRSAHATSSSKSAPTATTSAAKPASGSSSSSGGGSSGAPSSSSPSNSSTSGSPATASTNQGNSGGNAGASQAQQLLNYLLAP